MIDPDLIEDDGSYAGYILRDCLNDGRISIKVYAKGSAGVSAVSSSAFGTFTPDGKNALSVICTCIW